MNFERKINQEVLARKLNLLLDNLSDSNNRNENVKKLIAFFLGSELKIPDQNSELTSDNLGEFTAHHAINCLYDVSRTQAFGLAVINATNTLLENSTNISVVEAGCGPVAFLGIASALQSPNVKLTLLDINKDSVELAKKVVKRLGLENRVNVINCDARNYTHDEPVDLLISETADPGLTSEPIVQICQNFSNQMSKDSVIIPESISLRLELRPHHLEFSESSFDLLTMQMESPNEKIDKEISFNGLTIATPYFVVLKTKVVVRSQSDLILKPSDSAITRDIFLPKITFPNSSGEIKCKVNYNFGSNSSEVISILE